MIPAIHETDLSSILGPEHVKAGWCKERESERERERAREKERESERARERKRVKCETIT